MKIMKCYDCEQTFEAETSDEMLNVFYPHYMSEHYEIISRVNPAEKQAWMERFYQDWKRA